MRNSLPTFRNNALRITEVIFLDANSYSYYNIHASLTLKKSLHDLMHSVRCFVSILLLCVFAKMCEMCVHNGVDQ